MSYAEKLADPRWQKRRLEIFQRDNWKCVSCGNTEMQLEVHHLDYFNGKQPWEYPDDMLVTVCRECHGKEDVRAKHEQYLLQALKYAGFMAVDILAFASALQCQPVFAEKLRNSIREFAKQ